MVEVGNAALLVGLVIAAYAAVASLVSAHSRRGELWLSARRAVVIAFGLTSVASFALVYAFFDRDFSVRYVAEYSSSDLPSMYTFSGWWAGLSGSLLLWAWLLSLFAAVVVWQTRQQNKLLAPYVIAVLMGTLVFFLGVASFASNPFERLPTPAAEGVGLNPLLENPGMFFHPPTLYLGFVGFAVPFAFAIAALATGRLDDQWIRSSRRWTLFAWLFLTLGNLLGAQWAYVELGWGGYWGWDPVENASFMPWLTGTAYLHSVMIQQRRDMLKVWNILLIIVTYALVLFGTLLTRSGLLSSVHSFSESSVGPLFIMLIGVVLVGSLWLLWTRLSQLRSEHQLDSFLSREASFLLNNLLLVGAAFAVFWGTIFPILSEAVRGTRIVVGPPFFDQVTAPIFLALIVLMGVCPLIGWRKASGENLARNFLYPLAASLAVAGLLYARGMRPLYAVLAFWALAFVATTILLEFLRGLRARHRGRGDNLLVALPRLVWANRPRYGGYIVHVGVILFALGVLGSKAYSDSVEATLAPGETVSIQQYDLTFRGLNQYATESKSVVSAALDVKTNGKPSGTMVSEKYFHRSFGNPVTEVGIRSGLREDLYVILASFSEDGTASFKVIVNPLIAWMWVGGVVMSVGTVIAFWPEARRLRRPAPVPALVGLQTEPSHA